MNVYTVVFYVFCLCFGAQAQIPVLVTQEMEARVADNENPSIVIGLFKDGGTSFYAAGLIDKANQIKADTNSLYEIGSITKTFTSLLLAKMVSDGKLKLDDPIKNFLPDSLKLADNAGRPIRFQDLSTHTSGLPRLPFGYNPPDITNPYKGYFRENVFLYLSRFGPQEVGVKHAYSNLAIGLLGETLAIIENSPYTDLITSEILVPLKLNNTFFNIPEEERLNFAVGYAKDNAVSQWDFDVMAPAGALRATLPDMITYGRSYLESHTLSEAQQLTTQTFFEEKASPVMGLAWYKQGDVISHGGGTGGFRTHLSIDLKNKIVVAVATNTADNDPSDLALYLLNPKENKIFSGEEEILTILNAELEKYTGSYTSEQYGLAFTVSIQNNILHITPTNQKAGPLDYVGNHTFKNDDVKARIKFELEQDLVQSMKLMQGGNTIEFVKK